MAWLVTVPIWNKNTSSKDGAEEREFIESAPTEEGAKVRAITDAAIKFPLDEGWAYDVDNVTVKELSQEEVWAIIEEVRNRNMEEGEERIEEALANLEKMGVYLRRPKSE